MSVCSVLSIIAVLSFAVIWAFGVDSVAKNYFHKGGCHRPCSRWKKAHASPPPKVDDVEGFDGVEAAPQTKMDYDKVLKGMALSGDMMQDQLQFAKDTKKFTSTAAHHAVFDHDTSPNDWLGLRRPNYRAVAPDATARSVPSLDIDQYPAYKPVVF